MKETVRSYPQESPKLSPLGTRIMHGVQASFDLSQGSREIQTHLLDFLYTSLPSKYILLQYGSPEILDQVLSPYLDRINVVAPHIKLPRWQRSHMMNDAWGQLMGYFYADAYKDDIKSSTHLYELVLKGLVRKDREYMVSEKPRPHRDPSVHDPHESYLRSYVVLGQNTGSEDLDELTKNIQSLIVRNEKDETPAVSEETEKELGFLVKAWEDLHPDQRFYPQTA